MVKILTISIIILLLLALPAAAYLGWAFRGLEENWNQETLKNLVTEVGNQKTDARDLRQLIESQGKVIEVLKKRLGIK